MAHIIFRLDYGGLENGLVNLINRIPPERYRHVIICLTDYNPEFRRRIRQPDVAVFALHKHEGHDLGLYRRCWSLLRRLRPAIAHTRNLAALEMQLPAWLAGARARVHGEHGWDRDPALMHPRHHRLRRWLRPLVSHYIALSGEITGYLETQVGVTPARISRIINGVDSVRFHPGPDRSPLPAGFAPPGTWVIGTVGRLEKVKDQINLARAFNRLVETMPDARQRLRLVIVGEGSLRTGIESLLNQAGLRNLAWLPGARDDAPDLLRSFNVFVLPSQAEGISNTILEAMACGLPVVATEVGGNAELVVAGKTGRLVPASDPEALALAIQEYMDDPGRMLAHGATGRQRIEERFSMEAMVDAYLKVYDNVLKTPLSP
ncbi:MAG: TIGR03088 family PEP-CTERM/XrtA system glycosyltransferase [Candidatus Competibacteraceae bacterium]|nr:TIGR03088 family PEP-CTERM/XrtA system glycosyltransferase [Candidatus Competibacteraceae bacterium]